MRTTILLLLLGTLQTLYTPAYAVNVDPVAQWTIWITDTTVSVTKPASSLSIDPALVQRLQLTAKQAPTAEWIQRMTNSISTAIWSDNAIQLIVKYQKNPMRAARSLTYIHSAMNDALIQATRNRQPWPEAAIAVHSAAAKVIAHLNPEEPAAQYESLAQSAALAWIVKGTVNLEAADQAWKIGQAVAEQAIQRALQDKADQVWDLRTRPKMRPGLWQASPPLNMYRPLEPRAAEWRTWAIPSSRHFTPPPPIAHGSAPYWKEVEQVYRVAQALTPAQKRIAENWNLDKGSVSPAGVWNLKAIQAARDHGYDEAQTIRLLAAVNVAMMDAFISSWDTKFTYWTERPVTAIRAKYDANFLPHVITPPFPSYTSGHATVSGAAAEVLSAFFPEGAQSFRAHAEEAALSRLYGGIHFQSDNDEGLKLGRQIGQYVTNIALPAQSLGRNTNR